MAVCYRTLQSAREMGEAADVFWRSMVGLPPLGDIDPVPGMESGRFLGAFDGGKIVGCADSYTSWISVPGGRKLPHAAVTHVGVLPTHTRRGIMTALMRRQIEDFARRGEVAASLYPSEGTIYERYGYGVATVAASARVVRDRARLAREGGAGGETRLFDQPDGRRELSRAYSGMAWNGAIKRPDGWWLLRHLAQQAERIKPYRVLHGPPGDEDGFAVYRPLDPDHWLHGHDRTIVVEDFIAGSPTAYEGLLRHLLSLDLVDVIEFASLPADDALPVMFTDPRAVRSFDLYDESWLRLIDVGAALAGRTYRPGGSVVIRVTDAILPANNGSYRISGSGAVRIDAPADITVDVASLARVYLGGARWWQLARSGRVVARAPGAIETADDLFATPTAPYCGTPF